MRKLAAKQAVKRTKGKHRKGPGLSVAEAAKRLDLPEKVIGEMIESGELPSGKFGRLVRIPERAVDEVLTKFGEPLHASND